MPAVVIIGAQWGDEGKGKATDLLAEHIDYVVKFNGGNNAGHTVVIGNEKYALHLLPSGILTPGVVPVISNGVVIDPAVLFEELDALNARGIDTSKLKISANAHVITSYNVTIDKVTERFLGKRAIGTTGRGIGPTYADKINRVGIRIQDLFDESILRQKVEAALVQKNNLLTKVYNRAAIKTEAVVTELLGYAERIRPYVSDTALELHQALEAGKLVLFEGDQLGLREDEVKFYDALANNESAVRELQDETLKKIAQELTQSLRDNLTVDWSERESVRAKLRLMVKRILKKYKYPPDQAEAAVELVLEQAQSLGEEWGS
jgi:adenylosuccinate synthase